ncbi:MAG: hypothetical protein IAF08_03565 [Rhizobacter sp.]|nr:hypothetical protein [Chlorobiales bacterium]
MKKAFLLSLCVIACNQLAAAGVPRKPEWTRPVAAAPLPKNFTAGKFETGKPELDLSLNAMSVTADTLGEEGGLKIYGGKRSPVIAAFFSAVLPGAGEFYAESYLRSALFLAVEVVSWALYVNFTNQGHNAERAFVGVADQQWSAEKYARGLNTIYGGSVFTETDYAEIRGGNYSKLNAFERQAKFSNGNTFSHTLPPKGAQQYYELIGKYETYSIGWDDYPAEQLSSSFLFRSQAFKDYTVQRGDANTILSRASTMISVVIINHVVSTIDAIFATSEYNRRISISAQMGVHPVTREAIPEAKVSVSF